MASSMLLIQRQVILDAIRNTARGEWKVLIVDEDSRKIIDNVLREDDILEERVMNIEQIEHKRQPNPDTFAVYILSPLPHIVDCVMADLEKRKYRKFFVLWTSLLPATLRERLDRSRMAQDQIALLRMLNIDFYPRETRLVTFRDPYSFPILYHPACTNLVQSHIAALAQKILSVCVALGEYPTIRYYNPPNPLPTHEASVLSSYVATAVQKELDTYAHFNRGFDSADSRPRGDLFILDRSMDVLAPFLHEFTYQAMAHDLLNIQEGDKVTFKTVINQGRPNQEDKDMEITEKDKTWTKYRHTHMAETLDKLQADFQDFRRQHPHLGSESGTTNVNDIKDMLAGMGQFQEEKEAFTLNLTMAQDCMDEFAQHKLLDLAELEQTLASGLDQDYRKPKNLSDQVVRLLDEDAFIASDRLRLVALYHLYRYGMLNGDTRKLLLHAKLPVQDESVLYNLELLGARISKQLKDTKTPPPLLFARKQAPLSNSGLSEARYDPALKSMLEEHIRGALDPNTFPYVRPEQAPTMEELSASMSNASLRSAKPTWAKLKSSSNEPRQRIIVFMGGGATYSEARSCYEISEQSNREVYLVTSHMLTPRLFLHQVGDLNADRRRLGIPADRPAKRAPAHLFEEEPAARPTPASGLPSGPKLSGSAAPLAGRMNLNGGERTDSPISLGGSTASSSSKVKRDKEDEKKKKHHFFSSKR